MVNRAQEIVTKYGKKVIGWDEIANATPVAGVTLQFWADVENAIQTARETEGTVVIDFRVEKEDSVYPMVPAGAELKEMIRRPMQAAVSVENSVKVEA